jgi:hypothetical protein
MPIPIGSLTINVPDYLIPPTGKTINQGYEFDLEYQIRTGNTLPTYPYTGYTKNVYTDVTFNGVTGLTYTGFTYIGIGTSRLGELKKYGSTGYTQNLYSGSFDDGIKYTGYTFTYDGKPSTTTILDYKDREDGYTVIMGNTSGFTKEEVFEQSLTRNEHFLGFIEEPRVYSDIFVDRGKQGVSEKNLRLTEIDNLGELSIYGNGFFKVRKQ